MNETIRYRAEDLDYCCRSVLENLRVPAEHAKQVSQCLVQADLRGVDSHGVIRLPVYAGRIQKGLVNPRPKVQFLHEHAAAVLLDGDNGLGAVVGATAMQRAIELATKTGIGLVCARHSNHFGVASFYVEKAIDRMCGFQRAAAHGRFWRARTLPRNESSCRRYSSRIGAASGVRCIDECGCPWKDHRGCAGGEAHPNRMGD